MKMGRSEEEKEEGKLKGNEEESDGMSEKRERMNQGGEYMKQ